VFTVVFIVPSSGCVARLGAGLSPGLREGPTPIDTDAQIIFQTFDPARTSSQPAGIAGKPDRPVTLPARRPRGTT
jgi:hypothetical protein